MKQFHAFKLDTTNHCLWRGDERVALTPKAFDLLRGRPRIGHYWVRAAAPNAKKTGCSA